MRLRMISSLSLSVRMRSLALTRAIGVLASVCHILSRAARGSAAVGVHLPPVVARRRHRPQPVQLLHVPGRIVPDRAQRPVQRQAEPLPRVGVEQRGAQGPALLQ